MFLTKYFLYCGGNSIDLISNKNIFWSFWFLITSVHWSFRFNFITVPTINNWREKHSSDQTIFSTRNFAFRQPHSHIFLDVQNLVKNTIILHWKRMYAPGGHRDIPWNYASRPINYWNFLCVSTHANSNKLGFMGIKACVKIPEYSTEASQRIAEKFEKHKWEHWMKHI